MSNQKRRGNVPALTDWQQRGFCAGHFSSTTTRTTTSVVTFARFSCQAATVGSINRFAAECGLDRLTADGHNDNGVSLLRDWVRLARQSPGADLGLVTVAGFGGPVRGPDRRGPTVWDAANEPRPGARRRLIAEVDALLDRETQVIANGYLLLDTQPQNPETHQLDVPPFAGRIVPRDRGRRDGRRCEQIASTSRRENRL